MKSMNRVSARRLVAWIAVFTLLAGDLPLGMVAPARAAEQGSPVIRQIVVAGAERVEATTVGSYLSLRVGDNFTPDAADASIKSLFATGLFADARLDMQGETLRVTVIENPIINQVLFEGNHHVAKDKLVDEIDARPRAVFTRSRVQSDVQRMVEVYRRSGYFAATITPKVVELPQKRVDLVFEIDEGPTTGIRRINFIGNKVFSDRDLKDVIVTKESRWFRVLSSNDNYDPDRLEYDREQLRQYYTNNGYADFRIVSATAALSPDQKDFYVTFAVDEGEKYSFGDIKVETKLQKLNAQGMSALVPIKKGSTYEAKKIEAAIDSLTFIAGSNGYAFVDVTPKIERDAANKKINITFEVDEGPRVYVERVDVVGNTRTLDHVIRREMKVAEGDAFNRVLLDRSRQRIRSLGFFKDVTVEELPGTEPDKSVVKVKVEETTTGELSFGAGFSSVDQFLFDMSVTERNLRGRGQFLRARVSFSSLRQQIDLRFTEPKFLGRNLAAGFDLFSTRTNFSRQASFDIQSNGGGLRFGFPTGEHSNIGTRYTLRSDEVIADDASCTLGLISAAICNQRGKRLTSVAGYTFSFDNRNDFQRPTRGATFNFSQDFAGIGGDTKYFKTESEASFYRGIIKDVVFSASYSAGYIMGWGDEDVRINDRFFKGGSSFRGFETAGLGPRELTYGDSLGGNAYAIGTLELSFPLGLPEEYGVSGALFSDFGTVGMLDDTTNPAVHDDLSLRASAGVSVFWKSPFGPVRFDFSQVLSKEDYDKTENFRFSTSTKF
jgi:outer membrane protein insertion porin family